MRIKDTCWIATLNLLYIHLQYFTVTLLEKRSGELRRLLMVPMVLESWVIDSGRSDILLREAWLVEAGGRSKHGAMCAIQQRDHYR